MAWLTLWIVFLGGITTSTVTALMTLPRGRKIISTPQPPRRGKAVGDVTVTDSVTCWSLDQRASMSMEHDLSSSRGARTRLFSSSSSTNQNVMESEENIKRLFDWAEDHECEGMHSTRVGKDSRTGLRGLFAGGTGTASTGPLAFAPGDYILAIPFTASLLVHDSLDSRNELLNQQFPDVDTAVLEGYAFLEKFYHGPDASQWKPYIDSLPQQGGPDFDATSDFWKEEDIRQLQIPRLMEESMCRKADVMSLACATKTNPDLLQWAVWIVRSRGFTTLKLHSSQECNGEDAAATTSTTTTTIHSRTSLIPILDMVNHADDPNAEVEVVEAPDRYDESFFALRATQPIYEGDPITVAYGTGQETSLDLFSKYGFWTSNNMADTYLDWSAIDARWSTTLQEDKKLLLETKNANDPFHTILSLRIHLKQLLCNSLDT